MKKTQDQYLIAFDMDGTLLNSKKTISFKTRNYLKKLSEQGHKIVLASGRPSRALWKYYYQLKMDTPMICYNGAYVFSPTDQNFKPLVYEFPKEKIIELTGAIRPYIHNIMCETDTDIWIDKEDGFLAKFFWYENMRLHYGELKDTLNENPMTCIIQSPKEITDVNVIHDIVNKFEGFGARFWTGLPYFELYYRNTSKGAALKYIADYYHIDKDHVIAFGDAENDIEMLEYAGIPVVMCNGKESLKETAKNLSVKDCDHNGIYYTLKKLLK